MPGAKGYLRGEASYTPRRHQAVVVDTDLPRSTAAIYVGSGGNINARMWGDATAVVYVGVPTGTTLVGNFRVVLSASTTAASMVAQYINN